MGLEEQSQSDITLQAGLPQAVLRGRETEDLHMLFKSSPRDGVALRIEDKKGVILDIGEDLSTIDHISLEVGNRFWYNHDRRIVTIPRTLESPREIFAALHEASHIRLFDRKPELKQQLADLSYGDEHQDALLGNIVMEMERNVWADTIQRVREIRSRKNIDLFALFESSDQFMGWLRAAALRTYECGDAARGIKSPFTKNRQVEVYLRAMHEELSQFERNGLEILFEFEKSSGIPTLPHGLSWEDLNEKNTRKSTN